MLLCIWFPLDTGVLTLDFVKTRCAVPVAAERTAKTHLLPSHVLYCSLKTGLAASLTDAASLIKTEAIETGVVVEREEGELNS